MFNAWNLMSWFICIVGWSWRSENDHISIQKSRTSALQWHFARRCQVPLFTVRWCPDAREKGIIRSVYSPFQQMYDFYLHTALLFGKVISDPTTSLQPGYRATTVLYKILNPLTITGTSFSYILLHTRCLSVGKHVTSYCKVETVAKSCVRL